MSVWLTMSMCMPDSVVVKLPFLYILQSKVQQVGFPRENPLAMAAALYKDWEWIASIVCIII